MKVIVHVKRTKEVAEAKQFEFEVLPSDRIIALKERISSFVRNPFSEVDVVFDAKALADDQHLAESGINDGASLDFVIKASEHTLVKQLSDMLAPRPLSIAELGLLYSHHRGFSVADALQALGRPEQMLRDFLTQQKAFHCGADDIVSVAGLESAAKPDLCTIQEDTACFRMMRVSVTVDVQVAGGMNKEALLDLEFDASDTVAKVKESVALCEMLPFPDQDLELDGRVLDNQAQLCNCGVTEGSQLRLVVYASEDVMVRQFVAILKACTISSPSNLSALYCCRYGVTASATLKTLGLHSDIRRFLVRHDEFRVDNGHVALARPSSPDDQLAFSKRFGDPASEPMKLVACSA